MFDLSESEFHIDLSKQTESQNQLIKSKKVLERTNSVLFQLFHQKQSKQIKTRVDCVYYFTFYLSHKQSFVKKLKVILQFKKKIKKKKEENSLNKEKTNFNAPLNPKYTFILF
jgi:hypothetical protein